MAPKTNPSDVLRTELRLLLLRCSDVIPDSFFMILSHFLIVQSDFDEPTDDVIFSTLGILVRFFRAFDRD